MAIESPSTKKKTHLEIPTKSEIGSQPLPNLPHEIIVEILTRLPVKSLMKFRSVCKSWLSLISDPQFVKTQLGLASKTDDYHTHQRLIFNSFHPNFKRKSCSIHSILNEQSVDAIELDLPLKRSCDVAFIVGSCNGLVCITIGRSAMFLWNPSTRKTNQLPDSGIRETSECLPMCGFGYDKSNDDYKVVMIFYHLVFGVEDSFETQVRVFSLRTNSWRRIGDFCHGIHVYDSGTLMNGSLHWTARPCSGSSYSSVIVSLDLAKETYGEVARPNSVDDNVDFTLCALNEFLCMFCEFPGRYADVWIMKEYGMRESWTKLFSVPNRPNPQHYHHSNPWRIFKNGEILVFSGTSLSLYNPKDRTFRNLSIHNMRSFDQVVAYFESLVSPNVDNVI